MLQDMLVEGTGTPTSPEERTRISNGPRAYAIKVKQSERSIPTELLYCFIGMPVSEQMLEQIRAQHSLSKNYGAVFIPMSLLQGVDASACRGIVGSEREHYVVRGLLPTDILRFNAIQLDHLAPGEGIVYASPEDFPGLRL